ncbi:MAG: relaxase/mobilization nuclease domain-containing protein [Ruminococcus sp.]|nr:relaxase/mobilization nuclease domain-containing protein [Ruminococcus sp.]
MPSHKSVRKLYCCFLSSLFTNILLPGEFSAAETVQPGEVSETVIIDDVLNGGRTLFLGLFIIPRIVGSEPCKGLNGGVISEDPFSVQNQRDNIVKVVDTAVHSCLCKLQAVIATHVDKDHLHSHIIVCSYSLSSQKYYANKESLRQFRRNSDGVCKALGIDIHPNLTGKGKSIKRYEWEQRKNGTSWKEQIRQAIDEIIGSVNSLNELLHTLEEHGYEVKRGKYISIKAPGQERFVRTKTLGEEYTEESLNTRITYRDIGSGITPPKDEQSKLSRAYAAILHDVRVLAEQHKKVRRKRNVTAEYSVDNDLDVYRLSAQLSVINKEHISSIGELEGRIKNLNDDYIFVHIYSKAPAF